VSKAGGRLPKSEAVPDIGEDAIAIGAKTVWMQEGIAHNAAADRARESGLKVVQSRCILKEHAAMR
jgi:predicted CoA-binding protein